MLRKRNSKDEGKDSCEWIDKLEELGQVEGSVQILL